ncbi:MAG: hypothetical protein RIR09_2871 [Pseudomonadota bacterium]
MAASHAPPLQLLSNGRYRVMVTAEGGGYSQWNGMAISRWHGDTSDRRQGPCCYLREADSGQVWSTAQSPLGQATDAYAAVFTAGSANLHTQCAGLDTRTEIAIAPKEDVELRRIHITNRSEVSKAVTVTSYAEVVLQARATDNAHPAFEKLFVETEVAGPTHTLICSRRPRSPDEPTPSMFHTLVAPDALDFSYETDRMRFTGRGRNSDNPQAMESDAALSGTVGAVLDPVVALRCRVTLAPGQTVVLDFFTGVASSRDACVALAARCHEAPFADNLVAGAVKQSADMLDELHCTEAQAQCFTQLAEPILFADAGWRAKPAIIARNSRNGLGQPALWALSISGDLPIVLLQVSQLAQMDVVQQLLQAQAFWRQQGLATDVVILVDDLAADSTDLTQQIAATVLKLAGASVAEKPGGCYVRAASAVPEATRVLLQAYARLVIDANVGPLETQISQRRPVMAVQAHGHAWPTSRTPPLTQKSASAPVQRSELQFANGLGGFSSDGREYVITVSADRMTPLPWVNVLANPQFGSIVSESGSASTWSENAQAFRLTPWANDPVADPNTEAFYLRDEESGHFWSPTVLPSAGVGDYVTRHGFGYSVFEHEEDGIASSLTMFVAIDAPIKFVVLTLHNGCERTRTLSVTGYLEWVLGDERAKTAMHIGTAREAGTNALFAHNPTDMDFAGRTAFFDVDITSDDHFSAGCDRHEFLGAGGNLQRPAAMKAKALSGAKGFALDPCAALRVGFTLASGQTRDIVFRLGAGATPEQARALVQQWRGPTLAQETLAAVKQHWAHTLGAVQVNTPDPSFNLLANGWLTYQVLACRLWARNAFYQSSGAFGFRDQLQDVMSLVHTRPQLVREHVLRAAARQFPEGDVQHWWHPPSGRGVRTRCSDDYLWLPLATCRYVSVTGDVGVLDEALAFLNGSLLKESESSSYAQPTRPTQDDPVASLYVHCVRAIEHGLQFGAHGLPLMGTGDWNDGMNLVGASGRGESVWLGFFLCTVLTQFSSLARQRADTTFADRCDAESARLYAAIERSAWDGAWYRRAWFDDGSPLGTSANVECRIDSIAQSWSVLSGGADATRKRQAMESVDVHLVHRDSAIVQLLDPPFNHSAPNPGYIQGYLPGVRENGGQYTHAAVWAAMAFAELGDAQCAWELFTLLDPIRHADCAQAVALYKVEPYVLASDVYAMPPHTGRGGWTWYTGSAGWMLRFMLESVLGLNVQGNQLRIAPCYPQHWQTFTLNYRYRETLYRIEVCSSAGRVDGSGWSLDGTGCPAPFVTLVDDRRDHSVVVQIETS